MYLGYAHPLFFSTPSKSIFLFITKHFTARPRISSKRASWLEQNTWKFCRESLLMVYKRDWVYLLLCQRPICETGSNNIYIKGSCLMSFERIFKRCKYMHVAGTIITSLLTNNDNLYLTYIPWLRFSRILQFSSLKPGGFRWVATLCKERDDPQYAWENIKYLFSIKMEISISIFNIVVNFKISGFNKGTGGKSGKLQFNCDGCILFKRRTVA